MSKNRLISYRRNGSIDPMVRSFALNPGDSVLDCTLGLGADAVVSSYFSGTGKVVGLESAAAIAYVIRWGMRLYVSPITWLQEAVRRITIVIVPRTTGNSGDGSCRTNDGKCSVEVVRSPTRRWRRNVGTSTGRSWTTRRLCQCRCGNHRKTKCQYQKTGNRTNHSVVHKVFHD